MDSAKIKNIIKLGRGLSPASAIMYFLGIFFALSIGATFDIWKIVLGFFIVLPGIFVGTFTNSYYDVDIDKNSTATLVSGGTKILSEHPELLNVIRNLIIFCFSLSAVLGLLFTIVFSYPFTFFAFVLISIFLAWAYTAPPIRLVYRGLGELWIMVMGGFIVGGFGYFVVRGTIDLTFLLFSVPLMLIMFAFAIYVEIPDRAADFKGHKKTIVVRKGERFGFIVGSLALAGSTFCYLLYYILSLFPGDQSFLIASLYSIVPLGLAVRGFFKYRSNPKTSISSIVSSSIGIASFIIFMDAYFVFKILT